MDLPLGFRSQGEQLTHTRQHLAGYTSPFGLKQASRQWYSKFSQALIQFGLLNQNQTTLCLLKDQALLLWHWYMWMTLFLLVHPLI